MVVGAMMHGMTMTRESAHPGQRRRFEGKSILITGGAAGIGAAAARGFAQEGGRLVIIDVNEQAGTQTVETIRGNGGDAEFLQADVTDSVRLGNALDAAIEHLGGVDVLFNHAGRLIVQPLIEATVLDFDASISANARSAFQACSRVLKEMHKAKRGSIVLTSSISASHAFPMEGLYCISKAAVQMLAKCIAIEYRASGVRANALCPAFVRTTHGLKEIEDLARFGQDWNEAALRDTQGRICEPEEVANAALFLASEDASFINGASLYIDNGWSVKG